MTELQPWAMLAKGPPWTIAGLFSSVWTRLGRIAAEHRALVPAVADDDVAEPLFEIGEVAREAQDRHDFRSDCDVEPGFARIAVADSAQRADSLAQGAVVHVEGAAPGDPAQVEPEFVAPVDVIVDHG